LTTRPNIIVSFTTGDHPIQSAQARALLASEDVFVCATVLLETEWVLRSAAVAGTATPKTSISATRRRSSKKFGGIGKPHVR